MADPKQVMELIRKFFAALEGYGSIVLAYLKLFLGWLLWAVMQLPGWIGAAWAWLQALWHAVWPF